MQVIELLSAFETFLSVMAANGLNVGDYLLLRPYKDYKQMQGMRYNKRFIFDAMKEKHGMSKRSVSAMVAKVEREVNVK